MKKPLLAVPSFPGSNGEVDNIRTLKRCGFDCFVFRWNDSLEKLKDVDGYFFGAGFSYEDRGRSGMVPRGTLSSGSWQRRQSAGR